MVGMVDMVVVLYRPWPGPLAGLVQLVACRLHIGLAVEVPARGAACLDTYLRYLPRQAEGAPSRHKRGAEAQQAPMASMGWRPRSTASHASRFIMGRRNVGVDGRARCWAWQLA